MKCIRKRYDKSCDKQRRRNFADATGKQQGRGAYVSKDVKLVEEAQQKGVLEKYYKADAETLEPVYKEIIRLIYREEIPK